MPIIKCTKFGMNHCAFWGAGQKVDMQFRDGHTARIFTALNGHSDIMKYLIETNADVNMQF